MAGHAVAVVLEHRTATPRVDALELAVTVTVGVPPFGYGDIFGGTRPLLKRVVGYLRLGGNRPRQHRYNHDNESSVHIGLFYRVP